MPGVVTPPGAVGMISFDWGMWAGAGGRGWGPGGGRRGGDAGKKEERGLGVIADRGLSLS